MLELTETKIDPSFPNAQFRIGGFSMSFRLNHHGAEISVIWLVERSAIKLLILNVTKEK